MSMSNHSYNDVLNHAEFPELCNNRGPKGCRLCSQVFSTTQALLIHLESHMAQEEMAIRRLYSLPQHVNSQKQLGSQFPLQPMMGDDGRIFQAQPQPIMEMSQSIRRNPFRRMAYDGSINDDGSKAYILKLEKPIKKIDFIDLVNTDDDNDNNSRVEEIDLDLKL